jgi:AcrR family transcriptional regulator
MAASDPIRLLELRVDLGELLVQSGPALTKPSGIPMTKQRSTRIDRRRARTRGQLVEAARHLIVENGVDSVTITQITEEADIGFGTFYSYYDSKEALVAEVVEETVAEIVGRVTVGLEDVDDPAVAAASIIRRLLALNDTDPALITLVLQVDRLALANRGSTAAELTDDGPPRGGLVRELDPYFFEGAEARRFHRNQLACLPHLIAGGLEMVCSARLTNQLRPEDDSEVAAAILVQLGLPEAEANDIATRPLAELEVRVSTD